MTYYFTSMDELLHEAFTRFASSVSQRFDRRMAAATGDDSVQAAVVAIVVDEVLADQRDIVLTHELYTLARRDEAYRDITSRWMAASRAVLEHHFDQETARLLDALIEGLTIHRSLDAEPQDADQVARAIRRVCNAVSPAA